MLKYLSLLLVFICAAFQSNAAENYYVYINLKNVQNDQLAISIEVPDIALDEIEFQMPKIVPGTYSISDFGRFVKDLKAIDKSGNEMAVNKLDDNRWKIENATRLDRINYTIDDSFDGDIRDIFEPGGTNIEKNENFILNNFGIVGYLKGMQNRTFILEIEHPEGFYGATALKAISKIADKDVFTADNYFELHDNPIMYSIPDTATVWAGNTEIQIAVYSPGKSVTAKYLMDNVKDLFIATQNYLGALPVEKYVILIYLSNNSNSGGFGALEHSYSTVLVMPEMSGVFLAQSLRDVIAHEFLHIITPLSIHSEQIHNYDFINPKMSKHLWMYEGATEYTSHHVQVTQGLIDLRQYLDVISGEIAMADRFRDDLPFTELSLNALDETADQYINVYHKGALITLCLDIRLRELSDGQYGVKNLMEDLSKKFGKDRPFEDEKLFDEIVSMTYPEIAEFFSIYVDGPTPIPYSEFFEKVGIDFKEKHVVEKITLGGFRTGLNEETQRITVSSTLNLNAFGQDLGWQEGDQIISINNTKVDVTNFMEFYQEFSETTKPGKKIKVLVMRNTKGRLKEKKLKARAQSITIEEEYYLATNPNATEKEIELRNAWLRK